MRRISLLLFFTLLVASTAFIVVTGDQLPLRVVSHFGGGNAYGGMLRVHYMLFTVGFATFVPLLIVGGFAWAPLAFPNRTRIPNRDYWLAPSRRDESLAALGAFGGVLGSIITVFVAAIHQVILQANRSVPPQLPLPGFWLALGGFFTAMLVWQVLVMMRFRVPR
jgi:hypothetical protein